MLKIWQFPRLEKRYPAAISTLRGGTLGTQQVQAGKMLARYRDTAYQIFGYKAPSF
ncbi:DUF3370 family protein [Microcoleus sp. AR_TQ3_B6]|uniref:DUF3370 family protein n=1 Tax=Microcoleus sp. AR_TQ3_B6 TaxID=3055284 RepID=UPI002FD660CC